MCQFLKKICATQVQQIDFPKEREALANRVTQFNISGSKEALEKLDSANQDLLEKIAKKKEQRSEKILRVGGSSLSGRKYSISCSAPNDRLSTTATRKRANTIGDMKFNSPDPWRKSPDFKSSEGFKVKPKGPAIESHPSDEVPRSGIPESSTLRPPTPTHEKKL